MTLGERLAETGGKGAGFDQIRLLAAIVVLLYHSRGVALGDIRVDPLFRFSGGFLQFGLLAVLVFFCISGFLVTPGLQRSGNVVIYLSNRAMRILPALFVVVFVSMFLLGPILSSLPLSGYFSDPHLYLYAKNAVTLSVRYLPGVITPDGQPIIINGALWTIYFEVLSYLALAAMALLFMLRRAAVLMMFIAFYLVYLSATLAPGLVRWMPDRLVAFSELFVYFAAGVVLCVFRDRAPFSAKLALGLALATLAALPMGLGPVFLPLCLPYVVIVCGLSRLPGADLVKRDLSYGLYLMHAPVLVTLILLFPTMHSWWIAAAITLVVGVCLSFLSWTFVEAPMLARKRQVGTWLDGKIAPIVARGRRPRSLRRLAISE